MVGAKSVARTEHEKVETLYCAKSKTEVTK
jgi:hypothetical protein